MLTFRGLNNPELSNLVAKLKTRLISTKYDFNREIVFVNFLYSFLAVEPFNRNFF